MMQIFKYLLALVLSPVLVTYSVQAQGPNWSEDIAPLIFKHCSSCHHQGAIAPFSLMNYYDVAGNALSLLHVLEEGSMPPWPADPDYRHFVNEAPLPDDEKALIVEWLSTGMEYGNPDLEPAPPVFPENGSLLDTIDFVVAIEPYTLQSNIDEYRWFTISNPFDEPIFVSKIEVMAGLENVVHHADLLYDLTGLSAANDALDPLPGFGQDTGNPSSSFYMNAWQPGANIVRYPENWGIEVPPEADFLIEIHYGPGGIGQVDDTYMNLQFIKDTDNVRSIKAAWLLYDVAPVLVDGPLVIPANEIVSFHQQSAPLTEAISLVSICPHMHYLGKSYEVWAELPDGSIEPLIYIPNWDFHWQKYYSYPTVQYLPAGTILHSEGFYDNTLENHDNPNNPPITVSKGINTTDEMFLCYFIYSNYEEGDELISMEEPLNPFTNIYEEVILNNSEIEVFPNPINNEVIKFNYNEFNSPTSFQFFKLNGEEIELNKSKIKLEGGKGSISLTNFAAGVYFLSYINSSYAKENRRSSVKIVVD